MIEALASVAKVTEYTSVEKIKASEMISPSIEINGQEISKKPLADYSNVVNEQMDTIKSIRFEILKAINGSGEAPNMDVSDKNNEVSAESENVNISELVDAYLKQLKELSPCPGTLEDIVEMTKLEKIQPEEVAKKRSEFNNNRGKLIKEWEEKNGQEWPTYKEDVYDKNGNIVRKAGNNMEAHHIKPLSLGGENTAGNITPMEYKDHNDHKGIHASDSPYSKITSNVKENQ